MLLGYVVAAWYVTNVVARPKAMAAMTVTDFYDLLGKHLFLLHRHLFFTNAIYIYICFAYSQR